MYYELLASAGGAVVTSKCKGQSVYKIAKCFYCYSSTIKESQVTSSHCLVCIQTLTMKEIIPKKRYNYFMQHFKPLNMQTFSQNVNNECKK